MFGEPICAQNLEEDTKDLLMLLCQAAHLNSRASQVSALLILVRRAHHNNLQQATKALLVFCCAVRHTKILRDFFFCLWWRMKILGRPQTTFRFWCARWRTKVLHKPQAFGDFWAPGGTQKNWPSHKSFVHLVHRVVPDNLEQSIKALRLLGVPSAHEHLEEDTKALSILVCPSGHENLEQAQKALLVFCALIGA